jgi:hypothetical protein
VRIVDRAWNLLWRRLFATLWRRPRGLLLRKPEGVRPGNGCFAANCYGDHALTDARWMPSKPTLLALCRALLGEDTYVAYPPQSRSASACTHLTRRGSLVSVWPPRAEAARLGHMTRAVGTGLAGWTFASRRVAYELRLRPGCERSLLVGSTRKRTCATHGACPRTQSAIRGSRNERKSRPPQR